MGLLGKPTILGFTPIWKPGKPSEFVAFLPWQLAGVQLGETQMLHLCAECMDYLPTWKLKNGHIQGGNVGNYSSILY